MKRILMFVVVAGLTAFTFSCEDIEPTPQFLQSDTELTVAPSASTVAVTASDSLDEVISFTWNDPNYTVGLSKSKFSLKVSKAGANFSRFMDKDFSGVLSGTLLGKELNGMALGLGGVIGEPITLDVMVVASQANNNEPKNSN